MPEKNPAAVALGKLKKGVKEKPSIKKREALRISLAKATAARKLKAGNFAQSLPA